MHEGTDGFTLKKNFPVKKHTVVKRGEKINSVIAKI